MKIHRPRKNSRGLDVYFKEVKVAEIHDPTDPDLTITFNNRKITWAMSPFLLGIKWRIEE